MSDVVYIGPGGRDRRRRPLLRTLVGDVLRRNRLEQRRTLADVARDARVSMPYLSEIERGRKEASSEVLSAVCAALRMELSDLLAEVRHDLVKDRANLRKDRAEFVKERADLVKERAQAKPHAAQDAAPAEPTAATGERGQLKDRAPVVSLDAARRRRTLEVVWSLRGRPDVVVALSTSEQPPEELILAAIPGMPSRSGEVVLLAA
jgi:XRE family transcriptional regulator, stress-response regulator